MGASDLGATAGWHLDQFPDGFYAQLGPWFIQTYYSTYVASPHALTLVVDDSDGRVAGYAVGTLRPAAHSRFLRGRHGAQLTVVGALCLLRRPQLWRGFLRRRALWYIARTLRARAAPDERSGSGDLAYIVVAPEARRQGHGSQLLDAFVQAARLAGVRELCLVTASGNQAARDFYEQHGWTRAGDRSTRDGHPLTAYRRHC